MRIAELLCRQFILLPVITISVGFSTAALAEEGIVDPTARKQLNSRYQQQEKRRRDLLKNQQQHDSTVRLQPEFADNPLPYDAELEQPCFVVQHIELTGRQVEKFEFALQNLLDKQLLPLSRCLGVKGINSVISQLQNQIIKAGYVTTRVLAEPQDMSTGVLVLNIIPGIVNRIKLRDNSSANRMLVTAVPVREGQLLNLRDIEQAVENLRRIPTATAEVDIVPSQGKDAMPGYSDLQIHHRQSKPFRLTLGVDDSGYDATGRYQGTATLSLDNPLQLSDLLYLSLSKDLGDAENDGGTDGHSLHYSLPLGYWLLSVTSSEHEYWQNVAGLNQSYRYSGKSRRHEAGLSRIVYRDSRSKLQLGFNAYKTISRNFIEDTEIDVQHRRMSGWVADLNYQGFIRNATIGLGLAYQRGTGAFDALPAPESAFDEGTSRPKIITTRLNFNYPFKLATRQFNFNSYWEAQWNKTTLVPQDRISIGGRYTVRGFDGEMTLLSERGWFSRNTLSMRLGDTQQQLYTGVDFGHVSGESADLLLGQSLAGWVVGIKGHWKGLFYDLFAGTPLDKPKGFEVGRSMGFSLTYQY